ncbi:MAG: hypothetical protein AUJ97_02720 [Bacteroidetes bacterium CG2_30_32_10]|nr:MAG: hypothetical protein AUJ97_02720 [Bacteroidetes bacterium CG2_30_32_10]
MNISLFAQKDKGNVITQERKLADFNAIELGNALNVILSQGEVQSIKVETNEGLQEFIKTEVDNGVLKITQSNKMKNPTKLIVYVTVKNINKITLTGASELKSETPIKSDKLELNSSGASEITLDLAVNELESNFSGASDITLNGTATTHNILISGASDLKAGGLVTQETTLNASVASDIEVNVKEKLTGDVSGASSLKYKEEPKEKHINTSGASEINGKDDTTKLKIGGKEVYIFGGNDNQKKKKHSYKYDGHWGGVELGVNMLMNSNNNLDLPASYNFLEQNLNKSVGVNLNIFEQNFNLNHGMILPGGNIGITTGLGISWDNYRFAKDITLRSDSSVIWANENNIDFKKNKLTSCFLNVPLIFEFQTHRFDKEGEMNKNFHIGVGGTIGYRIGSHTKQVYEINGKTYKPKVYDQFHLSPFRYGLTARVGWGFINLFANYSLSTLFEKNEGPEMYPLMVGVSIVNW